jgi:D-alanyl-lipoteichoic acid acyltransferase DltB (MBOAT superfamily)
MLFNSYEFLLAFLPLTLIGFYLAVAKLGMRAGIIWLILTSAFFYGWWNPSYVGLLAGSIVGNFVVGTAIARQAASGDKNRGKRNKPLLALGIAGNLVLLGYYKYAGFFVANLGDALGTGWSIEAIILPLAISFFTFTQITFLVDSYRGVTNEPSFVNYVLFVLFFPHLIAGPIVHHSELIPQFARRFATLPIAEYLAVGLTVFVIGLFKKVVIADGIAPYASVTFAAAAAGETLELFQAWSGALAYTFQLYFDFSGYSDMAIGASYMFGIRLPLNFHSPYQATSIIEFWRRWHMSLSRFLRDYVYIPLGGNRHGPGRRYANLMATMLLGGLWHGAGWTFVLWGGLHGLYLVVNHLWARACDKVLGPRRKRAHPLGRLAGWALTFLAVVVAWVFFRADSLGTAFAMLGAMAGQAEISLPMAFAYRVGPLAEILQAAGVEFQPGGGGDFIAVWSWIAVAFAIACFGPNTQQIVAPHEPALPSRDAPAASGRLATLLAWRPGPVWAIGLGIGLAICVLSLSQVSEFLYFQF